MTTTSHPVGSPKQRALLPLVLQAFSDDEDITTSEIAERVPQAFGRGDEFLRRMMRYAEERGLAHSLGKRGSSYTWRKGQSPSAITTISVNGAISRERFVFFASKTDWGKVFDIIATESARTQQVPNA